VIEQTNQPTDDFFHCQILWNMLNNNISMASFFRFD